MSSAAADEDDYSDRNYWERRFAVETKYEWLCEYKHFAPIVDEYVKDKNETLLHIGCGTSSLSHDMHTAGFADVINVDFSQTLIDRCAGAYQHMQWVCADMRDLSSIPSNSIGVVIEKAAIDSLTVNEKSQWTMSKSATHDVHLTLKHVFRVLKNGGVFVSISFTQPHFRLPYYIDDFLYDWSVRVHRIGSDFHHFVYVMVKGRSKDFVHLRSYMLPPKRSKDDSSSDDDDAPKKPARQPTPEPDTVLLSIDPKISE